jgi:hypothetical protein
MERQILIEPLQKRFTVALKNANKEARNRYYPNASDCCGVKLKQEKFCSSCNAKVEGVETRRKIIKIGKAEHLIESKALKQVKESLEAMETLEIHTFLKELPANAEDRFDNLVYVLPVEKKLAQYSELIELLKGKVAVGKGVFNGNEYQFVVSVGSNNVIKLRKLVEQSQIYDINMDLVSEAVKTSLNPQIIALERQIIDRKLSTAFDISQFRDSRTEYEEKIIEEFVINGTVPEIKTEIAETQEQDELERLKALI